MLKTQTSPTREEMRKKLRQDAIKAHDEYLHTGLHATSVEVKDWLSDLAKGNNVEPPESHA